MSDLKAKMHHIRLWLWLCPRPLAALKGAYTSKGWEGREMEQEGREVEGREERGMRKGREGRGRNLAYTTFRTLRRHCVPERLTSTFDARC